MGHPLLDRLSEGRVDFGLVRIREILSRLGNPERSCPVVHIAGTNGKGSTCAMLAEALGARYRVGLYTSPHLLRPNERIRIDGVDVSDEELDLALSELESVLTGDLTATYFEALTVAAFLAFRRAKVAVAILETGLGGRLDATNVCDPMVAAITPLSMDHEAYLGTTLASIAKEKAGIFKPGATLLSATQPPEALEVLEATAAKLGSQLFVSGRDFRMERDCFFGRGRSICKLHPPLHGQHQWGNLALALAILDCLDNFRLSPDELRFGLARTRWPGRFEEIDGVVLDGAHNPAGIEVLAATLAARYPTRAIHLVFGAMGDKALDAMMQRLFPQCTKVYLTPVENPRSFSLDTVLPRARTFGVPVEGFSFAEAALKTARREAGTEGLVVVAGSLFLVGELRHRLKPFAN